jgi:ankyrin repeat protein
MSNYKDRVSGQRGGQPSGPAQESSRTLVERFSPAKVSDQGRTMVAQLCQAARDRNVKWADHLLKTGAQVNGFCAWSATTLVALDRHNNGGKLWVSPLSCAAEAGSYAMVEFLINHGADANDLDADRAPNGKQKTRVPGNPPMPLHWAVTKNHTAIVDLLLTHGAVASVTCTLEGVSSITPLHLAESGAKVKSLVAAGALVSATDSKGRTPLHYAETQPVAQALVDDGASVFLVDEEGQTPLFSAAMQFAQHYRVLTSPGRDTSPGPYSSYSEYSAPIRSTEEKLYQQPATGKAKDFLQVMKVNLDNDAPVNLRDKAGYTALARLIDCLRGEEPSGTARAPGAGTEAGKALLEKGAAEPEPDHPCHGNDARNRVSRSALVRRTPRIDPQFVTAVITSTHGRALGRALGIGRP